MADVNKVWLNGLVMTQPVMTQVGHDTPSTVFLIKVDENFTDRAGNKRTKSNFLDIESLGKAASRVKTSIQKGMRVWIEGYLRQERDNTENIVKIRTFAVYKDATDNNRYHQEGIRTALDTIKRSRDLGSAIEGLEEMLR